MWNETVLRSSSTITPFFSRKVSNEKSLLVSAERFELSTNGLKGHCSAIELRAHHLKSGLHSNMGNIHRQRKSA